jgi:hypothetical protein
LLLLVAVGKLEAREPIALAVALVFMVVQVVQVVDWPTAII